MCATQPRQQQEPHDPRAARRVEELLSAAAELAGVGICLYDTRHFLGRGRQEGDGWSLNRHTTPFCRYVLELPGGREACIASDVNEAVALAGEYGGAYFHTCHAGLTELVIPLYHHGEQIATLFCGQCRLKGETTFSHVWHRLHPLHADREKAEAYFMGLPVADRTRLLAVGALLGDALHHLIAVKGRTALEAYFLASMQANDPVVQAIRYIERTYQQPIGAGEVAAHVCRHPAYLARLFTARLGHGITDHITHVRLEHAQSLLRDTKIPICSIAENVGFADANYFSRRFKAAFGCTPSAYRLLAY